MRSRAIRLLIPLACLASSPTWAQSYGEALEASPEALDAAFSEADAAREAALWSDVIIDRSRPDPITAMTASADWVIRGTVTAQAFIDNEKNPPFTHTTIVVDELLKGQNVPSEITLVQQGGISPSNPENIVMVSHGHYFSVGEEELLFIDVNPEQTGHRRLVIEQRFRIYEGQVYDENGRGLIVKDREDGPGLTLEVSRNRHPSPRFAHFYIGPHRLTKNFSSYEGPLDFRAGAFPEPDEITSYQSSVSISDLSARILGEERE
jgi:hypothetical protein